MTVITVQNDFTHGEFDPRMAGRFDLELYRKGAKVLRNVVVISQGGARRRFGSEFIIEQAFGSNAIKMSEFLLSEEETFLLIFTENSLQIYLDDVLVQTILTPYLQTEIRDLKLAQTNRLMVISHINHKPKQLVPPDVILTWTFTDIDFKFVPAFDFRKDYNGDTFTLSLVTVGSPRTLTSTGTPFVEAHVGGVFFGAGATFDEPLGYARITAFTDTSNVTVQIVVAFDSIFTTGQSGKDVALAEKAWSDLESDGSGNRGWPNAVTFYQDRLWFGGARSLPETMFGSKVGDFENFDLGTGLDDDSIIETLATKGLNLIKHLVSDRTLQIFTFTSEFAPPQLNDVPMTPTNASIRPQTPIGTTDVDPVVLDNQTIFVGKGGKGVYSFVFDFDVESYQAEEISILSASLIRNPVDSAVLKGSSTDDSNYYFLVNGDGTLAVFQIRKSENVSAWTLSDTDGQYIAITQVGAEIYVIVQRKIEGIDKNYLEKFSFDELMDSDITQDLGQPTLTVTGLEHLEGKLVGVIGDGFVLQSAVVVDGKITLEEKHRVVTCGLNFIPVITPLPVVIQTNQISGTSIQGLAAYTPRRLVRVFVQFYESLGVLISQSGPSVEIPSLEFGPDVLNQPPDPKTGVHEFRGLGWSREPIVTITQDAPLPMTILAIGYEVEI